MATLRTMNRRRWRRDNPRSQCYVAIGMNACEVLTNHWEAIRGGRWVRCSPRDAAAEADFLFDEDAG